MVLVRLLYHHLRGLRLLILLAVLLTFAQVGCDLVAAMPLKFIPSKVNNPGSDPACSLPFLDPVLSLFDTPALDPSLRPLTPGQSALQPPTAPCPASPSDPASISHPRLTHHSVIGVVVFSLLMLLVFGGLSALLAFVTLSLATLVAQRLTARLRQQVFDHLEHLPFGWHDRQSKGDLVQRLTGSLSDIEKLISDGLIDLLAGLLTLLGIATIMLWLSLPYTMFSLSIAPLLFLLVGGYTGTIKRATRQKARVGGKLGEIATEDLHALSVVRAFRLEEHESQRFGKEVQAYQRAGWRAGFLQGQFSAFVAFLVVVGTLLVVGIGGYVAAGNNFHLGLWNIAPSSIDVGTLVLFLTYLKMLYQPMRDLSKLTTLANTALSGAERVQEILSQAPEVGEPQQPYRGPQRLRGEIRFEKVSFGYQKDQPVLHELSLHIPAGRKVALVGYSGSGKTTLARMIPRFYERWNGQLMIDGVPVENYPLSVLRANISLVLQDSLLFAGTVRENLSLGRPEASFAEIVEAAKKASIHDEISTLPEGYETMVREGGSNFSAGQRQRLAIARAILRDTPILILDEPTANLDVEAEAQVMHALSYLMEGRTVLTISHRLSTLGQVDEIIVLSQGRIVEQGSYRQLKAQGGLFSRLLEEQNRYNLERLPEPEPEEEEDQDKTLVVRAVRSTRKAATNGTTARKSLLSESEEEEEEETHILRAVRNTSTKSRKGTTMSSEQKTITAQLKAVLPAIISVTTMMMTPPANGSQPAAATAAEDSKEAS